MIERPDVDSLLAGPLGTWLNAQEAVRRAAKKATWDRRFIVTGVLGVLTIFALIAFRLGVAPVIAAAGALFIVSLTWTERPVTKAVRTVKVGINDAIADALGLRYNHDCQPGLPFQLAKACRILPRYDRATFEDEWSGHVGDIPFNLHEAKLEELRKSGKRRRWVTVFEGLILSVGYSQRFHGTTLLVKDNAYRKFWGGKSDSVTVNGMQLDYADMTHPDFEDRFDVYTSDQVEARHLIDPLYVERLIALERSYRGRDTATIFHEGKLVITLKAGNMFESGSIDADDDRRRITTTVEQFMRVAELARQLNSREPLTSP